MRVRAAIAITCVLALAGCKLNTDYFKEYRGKNLLANWDFNATGPAPASTPKWDLESYPTYVTAYGVGYDPTDYMTWATASDLAGVGDGTVTTLSVGPDGSSPAYRLEIKNLFNDGDFESATNNATISDSWWTVSSPATGVVGDTTAFPSGFPSTFSGNYSPIDSKSLFFSGTGSGNQITLTLNSTSVPLWSRPGGYQFRFSYRYTGISGQFHASYSPATSSTAENAGGWDKTSGLTPQSATIVSFSHYFTLDNTGTTHTLTLGTASNQDEAVIDDVRVVHNDIAPYVTMSFPSLKSGSLQLLPGSKPGDYKLSFWVHDDPTADQTNALHAIAANLNRLNPSGVTVQVTAAVQSGSTGTYIRFLPRPAGGWTTWTHLTFSMGFNFVNSDGDIPPGTPALKIEIAPTNALDLTTKDRDVGSLLITQPSFTFNP